MCVYVCITVAYMGKPGFFLAERGVFLVHVGFFEGGGSIARASRKIFFCTNRFFCKSRIFFCSNFGGFWDLTGFFCFLLCAFRPSHSGVLIPIVHYSLEQLGQKTSIEHVCFLVAYLFQTQFFICVRLHIFSEKMQKACIRFIA